MISILGVLILIATPKFIGYTKQAQISELTSTAKIVEFASKRYYMHNDDWPKLASIPYTAEEVEGLSEKLYYTDGKEVALDRDGEYYDIDFIELSSRIGVPGESVNYIIQIPAGKVYTLYKPTEDALKRLPSVNQDCLLGIY